MPDPASLLNKAIQLARSGNLDEAMGLIRQMPPSPVKFQFQTDIQINRGSKTDLEEAEKTCLHWRKLDPTNIQPLFQLMQLYWKSGRNAETPQLANQAGKMDASHKIVPYYHAVAQQLNGRFQEALASHRLAIQRNAVSAYSETELALEVAISAYEVAAGHYPASPGMVDDALVEAHESCELLENSIREWLAGKPDLAKLNSGQVTRYGNACYNLACVDTNRFEGLDRAVTHLRNTLLINPEHNLARTNLLLIKNYEPGFGNQQAFDLGRKVSREIRHLLGPSKTTWDNNTDPGRKLRIAYLSSDFCRHSVAFFITPVLEAHDRRQLEVNAYYTGRNRDEWTQRAVSAVDHFVLAGQMSDEELHRRITNDRIDILVDLNGFTKGHRVGVLMRRAAPVQVSWIGYPGSTGLDVMDYRIVDSNTDPIPEALPFSNEKLLVMDPVFSVYQPDSPLTDIIPGTPASDNGYITFGSFNALPKLNSQLFSLWGRILSRVEGSKLLVKNRMLDQPSVRKQVSEALSAVGIARDRQILIGRTDSPEGHLKIYQRVDLCLDSYPYNGTTTNCDSFIMGVPVITLSGTRHVSRVTTSQLRALDLDRLIAADRDQYVEKAVSLANDKDVLIGIRDGLRERFLNSALMNHPGFTSQLESKYREIWHEWCESE